MISRRALFAGTALAGFAFVLRRSDMSVAAAEKTFAVTMSDEEWRRKLTPAQYDVLRKHGTERAGTSPL
ncbi:MAG: peptide-methionine (R)-S-oxide reductase, partial [Variibacter sp.]|nr:peptide-methionine (R)-S-oxide reductase [Variibacter sp.]